MQAKERFTLQRRKVFRFPEQQKTRVTRCDFLATLQQLFYISKYDKHNPQGDKKDKTAAKKKDKSYSVPFGVKLFLERRIKQEQGGSDLTLPQTR